MRRATLLVSIALVGAGCSIVFDPNEDDIIRRPDAGVMDAGDAGDAGYDAGDAEVAMDADAGDAEVPDGGCMATPRFEALETTCNDGIDNDCNGQTDCFDTRCANDGYCCSAGGGGGWGSLEDDLGVWSRHGSARLMGDRVEFGTGTGQLIHPTCAPLAYGLELSAYFDLTLLGAPTDYAAIVLAPVDAPRGDGTLTTDLALRVDQTGMATLERAGSVIATAPGPISAAASVGAVLELTPGVDDMGRPVLLVSAEIGGMELATQEVLGPLDDLLDADLGCTPDGLFLAFDGRGPGVEIDTSIPLSVQVGDCDNPTQFRRDSDGPLGDAAILAPGTWRAGGAGEPALQANGSPATQSLDLLVDASEDERSDEIWSPVDFAIGGSIYTRASGWTQRSDGGGGPELTAPSTREPAYAARHVAFAERIRTRPEVYQISIATLGAIADESIGTVRPVLTPGDAALDGCPSLRDPALVSLDGNLSGTGLLLFYHCDDGADDTIGVARIVEGAGGFEVRDVNPRLLDDAVGDYATDGVTSPEVVVTSESGGVYQLRVWFLAHTGSDARVALAYGEVAAGELPTVEAYPGNPILAADDQVLGGECAAQCAIESFGVTATEGSSSLWSPPIPPSYLFLIERTLETGGPTPDHQLIPLRQPRPSGG